MAPARDAAAMAGGAVPPWPLFSLQPCLLDAAFVRAHMYPFAESAAMNESDAYWLWELEAALRFVKHGGTKASVKSGLVARQIDVKTSSREEDDVVPVRGPRPARRKFAVRRG